MLHSSDAYGVDLAYVHDTGFGDLARHAASHLRSLLDSNPLAQCSEATNLIVDLGCGSGVTARMLVDAGYRVIGVDVSSAMIALARQRVPEATFALGSFAEFPIPACRAVTALGEVFNYLFDASNSLATLRRVFQRIFDALIPGGVLMFDLCEPGRSRGLKQVFRKADDWACLVEYQHDAARQQLTRRIITFRRLGDTYRRHEETHRQQLYNRVDVAELLRGIGFAIEILTGYGQHAFPASVVGFIARKP